MTQDITPRGLVFRARVLHSTEGANPEKAAYGGYRALKIGPGRVLSYVVKGSLKTVGDVRVAGRRDGHEERERAKRDKRKPMRTDTQPARVPSGMCETSTLSVLLECQIPVSHSLMYVCVVMDRVRARWPLASWTQYQHSTAVVS